MGVAIIIKFICLIIDVISDMWTIPSIYKKSRIKIVAPLYHSTLPSPPVIHTSAISSKAFSHGHHNYTSSILIAFMSSNKQKQKHTCKFDKPDPVAS